jgi:hypothetical protein
MAINLDFIQGLWIGIAWAPQNVEKKKEVEPAEKSFVWRDF